MPSKTGDMPFLVCLKSTSFVSIEHKRPNFWQKKSIFLKNGQKNKFFGKCDIKTVFERSEKILDRGFVGARGTMDIEFIWIDPVPGGIWKMSLSKFARGMVN